MGRKISKKIFTKKIVFYDSLGFGIVILFLWMNEILDIPHLFFGAKHTPINLTESIFETIIVFILLLVVLIFTSFLIRRIKYLEGFLQVCSSCKKIKVNDEWIPIEDYIRGGAEAKFSHGLCPECAAKYIKELSEKKL